MDSPETSIRLETSGPREIIQVAGPLDLSGSALVQQALFDTIVAASTEKRAAALDLSQVTRVDLAGLQLLCSTHRTAVNRGGHLEIGQAPDWFHEACQSVGFDQRRSTCPHRRGQNCLWRA
ncbi:MAG TPA: STAS domain-containing protein [Verrucomicrobiae bacterium]|nr:STAS domain-containing protein [Verrucomicrobiae bacterium]